MAPKPCRILFVCTGNTCRSPMAAALLRHRLGDPPDVEVLSAGISAPAGSPASANAVAVMAENGISLENHRATQVDAELLGRADLVVALASSHQSVIARVTPEHAGKVRLLTSFVTGGGRDVADPFGGSLDAYRHTRDQIDGAITDLILHLRDSGNLRSSPLPKSQKETTNMKIALGADHGGLEFKQKLLKLLAAGGAQVVDMGVNGPESVDYPDYAAKVAGMVSEGSVDQGVLVCTTGVGMSITANRFPRVRAALCTNAHFAKMSRSHNNANILCLPGSGIAEDELAAIVKAWLETRFDGAGRHERRLDKIEELSPGSDEPVHLYKNDPEIYSVIQKESRRQRENIELIASENYASRGVREANGSLLTNKYAEGYPAKRWYHGCEFVDEAEQLAIDRARQLFGAEYANVQPHSGSGANMAVYFAVLQPGDTILGLSLADGGHLTHGLPANFSGRFFKVVSYGVDRETERLDYAQIQKLAEEHRPKMIVAGASAYSRIIDFKKLRAIADGVGAYLMADMAHIAGLVATGFHPNPVPYCEFVTSTTHKTLRGPRGGLILSQERFAADIAKQIFPGIQGGPLMHTIAAKAVCFHEALQPSFKIYQEQVIRNAQTLAAELEAKGLRIVSGGTDNHLMLADLTKIDVTGKDAAAALDKAQITVNKNAIPFDKRSPFVTSGIRVGSPAVTTRGMKEAEMKAIAGFITDVLKDPGSEKNIEKVRKQVLELTARFPVP